MWDGQIWSLFLPNKLEFYDQDGRSNPTPEKIMDKKTFQRFSTEIWEGDRKIVSETLITSLGLPYFTQGVNLNLPSGFLEKKFTKIFSIALRFPDNS